MIDPSELAEIEAALEAFDLAYVRVVQATRRVLLLCAPPPVHAGVLTSAGATIEVTVCSLCGAKVPEDAKHDCRTPLRVAVAPSQSFTADTNTTVTVRPAATPPPIGDPCPKCYALTLVRDGTCMKCLSCYWSAGCGG